MVAVAELAGVSVRRGTALLLHDVNFKVEEGDRWVIIGPNGAGKSTLLALLSTQMHPTTGVVEVLGEYLGAVDVFELRPRIGVASSSIAHRIPNREKVADAIVSASYGVMGRWRETYEEMDHARALELMRLMHVEDLAGRTYGTLSEGERKRVEIARALMTDPELLLLDEFSIAVDPVTTMRIEEVLKELRHELTIVLVTNLVQQARRLADRTAFFLRGRCVEIADTETMFSTGGAHQETSDYLGGRFG